MAAAVSENMGKFGPVAGLSTRAKNMGKISTFDAPSSPATLETHAMRSALSGRRWPSPAAIGTPHAYSDAAEPISRSTPLMAVIPVRCLPPHVFEIFTFQSVKHTGIGAHFRVKLLEIWARIRHINETYLGAFQSKLWPGPTPAA